MKNSSRLAVKIARNFTRSRSGVRSSSASASTRALKSSQLRSRSIHTSASVSGSRALRAPLSPIEAQASLLMIVAPRCIVRALLLPGGHRTALRATGRGPRFWIRARGYRRRQRAPLFIETPDAPPESRRASRRLGRRRRRWRWPALGGRRRLGRGCHRRDGLLGRTWLGRIPLHELWHRLLGRPVSESGCSVNQRLHRVYAPALLGGQRRTRTAVLSRPFALATTSATVF